MKIAPRGPASLRMSPNARRILSRRSLISDLKDDLSLVAIQAVRSPPFDLPISPLPSSPWLFSSMPYLLTSSTRRRPLPTSQTPASASCSARNSCPNLQRKRKACSVWGCARSIPLCTPAPSSRLLPLPRRGRLQRERKNGTGRFMITLRGDPGHGPHAGVCWLAKRSNGARKARIEKSSRQGQLRSKGVGWRIREHWQGKCSYALISKHFAVCKVRSVKVTPKESSTLRWTLIPKCSLPGGVALD